MNKKGPAPFILGPDGKPVKTDEYADLMIGVILDKLYIDGFVRKNGDVFEIDAGERIDSTYGSGDTSADIRAILIRLVRGLYVQGKTIKVGDLLLEGPSGPGIDDVIEKIKQGGEVN